MPLSRVRTTRALIPAGTGIQNITVPSAEGTPVAAIVQVVGTGANATSDTARISMAFTDGTNHKGICSGSQHGVATSNTVHGSFDDALVRVPNATMTGFGTVGTFNGFTTGGISINWTAVEVAQFAVHVTVFFGTVVQAAVGSVTPLAVGAGTAAETIGFQAQHAIFLATEDTLEDETLRAGLAFQMAHAVSSAPSVGSLSVEHRELDASASADVRMRLARSDPGNLFGAELARKQFAGTTQTLLRGFSATDVVVESAGTAGQVGPPVIFLALNYGPDHSVALFDERAPTADGVVNYPNPNFRPDWTSTIATACRDANFEVQRTSAQAGPLMIGSATIDEQWNAGYILNDNSATMDTSSRTTNQILSSYTDNNATEIYGALWQSVDNTSETLDWVNGAPNTIRNFLMFMLEIDNPVGPAVCAFPKFGCSASGINAPPVDGTSACTFPGFSCSATGVQIVTGTSACTFPGLGCSATGLVANPVTGAGACTFPGLSCSATGQLVHTGVGACTFPGFACSATGNQLVNPTGTSACTFSGFSCSATGLETIPGTSACVLPNFGCAATGAVAVNGSGACTFPGFSCSASAVQVISGVAACTFPGFSCATTGVVALPVSGSAACTFPALGCAGQGGETFQGSAACTLPSFACSATGNTLAPVTGTAACTLPKFGCSATGVEIITGTAACTLPKFGCSATGNTIAPVTGTSACAFPKFSCMTSGQVGDDVTGVSNCTLPKFGCSADGNVANLFTGTVSCTFPKLGCNATGVEIITGATACTLPKFGCSATGSTLAPVTGAAACTLPKFGCSATGVQVVTGSAACTLPKFGCSATGATVSPITGTSACTFPGFSCSASGGLTVSGASTCSFPSFSFAALGGQGPSGVSACTFPSLSFGGVGFQVMSGFATCTFPGFACSATGAQTVNPTGAASCTFPGFSCSASGKQDTSGQAACTFPGFGCDASGIAAEPVSGASACTFPGFSCSATGNQLAPVVSSAACTFPAFRFISFGDEAVPGQAACTFPGFQCSSVGALQANSAGTCNFPSWSFGAAGSAAFLAQASCTFPLLACLVKANSDNAPPTFEGITLRKLIYDAILASAKAGQFIEALHDADQGAAPCTMVQGANVQPSCMATEEVTKGFKVANQHGRKYMLENRQWIWELKLEFNQKVITELFEDNLAANPIVIPRNIATGVTQQVIIELLDATYEHPHPHGASCGTKANYRLLARVCPK